MEEVCLCVCMFACTLWDFRAHSSSFYQRGHSACSRPPYYPPTQFRDALEEAEARLVMLRCNQTVCVLKGNQSGGHISIDSLLAIYLHLNGAIALFMWI